MSRVVKDKKAVDAVELYQFFSDFALDSAKEEAENPENKIEAEETNAVEEAPDFEAASQAAEKILEDARQEAERILADAKKQGELLREKAFQDGQVEGYEAGRQEAQAEYQEQYNKELQNLKKDMTSVIDSVRIEKSRVLEKYQDDLKRIVLAIAEKIIHTSLKSSENVIHRMIMSATDKLKKTEWAKIYITKCNTEISMDTDVEFLNALSHLSDNVKIVTMDNEEEGICIIELPEEIIDASVSTQLENIKDILNNARI